MKNIKLNLVKSAKAGFSLVEMLVVIAVIGVIAAIAIPNIGNINESARVATATRNAQSVASTLNAALAAGWDGTGLTNASTAAQIVAIAEAGVAPTAGAFAGKNFTTGAIAAESKTMIDTLETLNAGMLEYNDTDKQVRYVAPTVFP